ncbi:MAG: hypothetical protein WBF53_00315 [Litorimonas sp.]
MLTAILLLLAAPASAQDDAATKTAKRDLREMQALLPGIYTNEEQAYFYTTLDVPDAEHLPRLELIIERDGDGFRATTVSPTGRRTQARLQYRVEDGAIRSREIREGQPDCERSFTREFDSFRGTAIDPTPTCGGVVVASDEGFRFGAPDRPFDMLRARTFKCWVSPRKEDGEYAFYNDLVLHDQGGRVWIEATEAHPRVGLKMRNVRWPTGVNRDSLVLYTYRGDDPDYAPGYTWTNPEVERLAINTRWLQASCTAGKESYLPNIDLKTGSGSGD